MIHLVRRRLGAICLIASGAACAHAGPLTILYETFAGSEIVAFNVATAAQIGSHAGNATNVAASGGKVFWQDGVNIFEANSDLTGTSLFFTNTVAPSGIALLPADVQAAPEPSAVGLMALGLVALAGIGVARRSGQAICSSRPAILPTIEAS